MMHDWKVCYSEKCKKRNDEISTKQVQRRSHCYRAVWNDNYHYRSSRRCQWVFCQLRRRQGSGQRSRAGPQRRWPPPPAQSHVATTKTTGHVITSSTITCCYNQDDRSRDHLQHNHMLLQPRRQVTWSPPAQSHVATTKMTGHVITPSTITCCYNQADRSRGHLNTITCCYNQDDRSRDHLQHNHMLLQPRRQVMWSPPAQSHVATTKTTGHVITSNTITCCYNQADRSRDYLNTITCCYNQDDRSRDHPHHNHMLLQPRRQVTWSPPTQSHVATTKTTGHVITSSTITCCYNQDDRSRDHLPHNHMLLQPSRQVMWLPQYNHMLLQPSRQVMWSPPTQSHVATTKMTGHVITSIQSHVATTKTTGHVITSSTITCCYNQDDRSRDHPQHNHMLLQPRRQVTWSPPTQSHVATTKTRGHVITSSTITCCYNQDDRSCDHLNTITRCYNQDDRSRNHLQHNHMLLQPRRQVMWSPRYNHTLLQPRRQVTWSPPAQRHIATTKTTGHPQHNHTLLQPRRQVTWSPRVQSHVATTKTTGHVVTPSTITHCYNRDDRSRDHLECNHALLQPRWQVMWSPRVQSRVATTKMTGHVITSSAITRCYNQDDRSRDHLEHNHTLLQPRRQVTWSPRVQSCVATTKTTGHVITSSTITRYYNQDDRSRDHLECNHALLQPRRQVTWSPRVQSRVATTKTTGHVITSSTITHCDNQDDRSRDHPEHNHTLLQPRRQVMWSLRAQSRIATTKTTGHVITSSTITCCYNQDDRSRDHTQHSHTLLQPRRQVTWSLPAQSHIATTKTTGHVITSSTITRCYNQDDRSRDHFQHNHMLLQPRWQVTWSLPAQSHVATTKTTGHVITPSTITCYYNKIYQIYGKYILQGIALTTQEILYNLNIVHSKRSKNKQYIHESKTSKNNTNP